MIARGRFALASGVYFLRIEAGGAVALGRATLLK